VDDDSIFIACGEIVNVKKPFVAVAETDATSNMLCVPDQVRFVSLPVLVE
jgi:hypothetical protein